MIKSYLSGFIKGAVVSLLVLVQFAFILLLSYMLSSSSVYIYYFLLLISIILIIGLVNDSSSPSFKIAWICVILVLPITGLLMYYLWGKPGSRKNIEKRVIKEMLHGSQFLSYDTECMQDFERDYPLEAGLAKYMETKKFPLFRNNRVSYYPMGEDVFRAIFEDIKQAEKFILIQFFIVGEGVLWDYMHELLLQKRKEGVEILFLYDDFGVMMRTEKYFGKNLEEEGIKVQVFNPIHKYMDKLYMNYRTHQKIIVIDGNIGYTGGMNLADEYVNIVQRFGVWKDNAVRVKGDAVWGLTVTFLQMWNVASQGEIKDYTPYRSSQKFEASDVYCQVISDGPANNPDNPIECIYRQIIFSSRKFLYITTPYLVLEDDMRNALILAVQRGVDVRIVTPFIPDKKIVNLLTRFHYGELLKAGVRILEYTPGFIHAKTIITENCGIVGTINMDYRSFYLHYECGVFICCKQVVEEIKKDLEETFLISTEITYEEWTKRPLSTKLAQQVFNMFGTMM